ncbi:hypothetical protein, partial [Klebsiella variicola]|uniref:hypothetical protein n=1 Tax=Klebsiella variicola TaxID=244366 RepID=UPI0015F34AA7
MNSNTTIALHFSLALLFTLLSVAGSNHDLAGVVSQLFLIFMAAFFFFREGANKQVISSQADSLIKISRIWADFFPANTS